MDSSLKKILFGFILLIGLSIVSTYVDIDKYFIKPCQIVETKTIYMAKNDKYLLADSEYISQDENIVVNNNGVLFSKNAGAALLIKECESIKVEVSDLYTAPIMSEDKEALPCGKYTKEENDYLDMILKYRIDEAGYKTRAGVVEAARFLLLRFPYHMNYFNENGRMSKNTCDGEGRYYHVGLYLNEYKTEEIVKSVKGPAPWGCPIYSFPRGKELNNSMDCSGFVSWCLLNGGFDPGDIGAGPSQDVFDLGDLGKRIRINKESLDDIKVGDLLQQQWGHIAILIGKDDKYYYVGESNYDIDVRVSIMSKEDLIKSKFNVYVDMEEYYEHNDGNLNDMWYVE